MSSPIKHHIHNVTIVGVGNCGSSLVQALVSESTPPGKLSPPFDDLVREIPVSAFRIVGAFDVDRRKIGLDISEAIFSEPNCTTRYKDIKNLGIYVACGPLSDGVALRQYSHVEVVDSARSINWEQVTSKLIDTETHTVINFLPVGSQEASEGYARAALRANANFINCSPAYIARDAGLRVAFERQGLVLIGDDLKSHLGASVIHGALTELFSQRGLHIEGMYQLNFGGNGDFLNMLEPNRVHAKRETKNATIQRRLDQDVDMTIGPSGYIAHLRDHKVCYINVHGVGYMGMPFDLDLKFRVEDSPNAAAVAVDMLRLVYAAATHPELLNDRVLDGYFKDPYTSARTNSRSHLERL